MHNAFWVYGPAPSLSLEISSRNITYKSYGQYGAPPESFLCGARHEPLTQSSMNMDFWIYGIFHEMFMTRKQNGGQNNWYNFI